MHRLLLQINSKDMNIRRNNPKITQKLWKTLEYRDFERNRKQFIQKLFVDNMSEFESETQLKTIITNAFEDQMIVEESDAKSGYRLVQSVDRKQFCSQMNDWYCFECHSSSADENLIGCKSCFRSFHESCLEKKISSDRQSNDVFNDSTISSNIESALIVSNAEIGSNDLQMDTICDNLSNIGLEEQSDNRSNAEPMNTDFTLLSPLDPMDFECLYCCRFKYPDINSRAEQLCGQQLNRLIELFFKKLEKCLEDIDIYEKYPLESTLTDLMFIFSPIDLNTIRIKALQLKNYHNFVEFENDLRHFCHNYSILKDGNQIQTFIESIDYELGELNRCLDCYIGSTAIEVGEEQTDKWFTRLCAPKHRVVFARFQRWPFWPSKVIQWDEDSDDCWVQFFEPKFFTIALVPKDNIRDIDYKFESKQLTTDKIIPSMALLFKYLTNWRNESPEDFTYESTYRRLKQLLAKNLIKTGNPVFADLDLQKERQKVVRRSSDKFKKQKLDQILDKMDDSDEVPVEVGSTQSSSDTSTQSTSQSSDELNELFYDILFEDENQEIPGEGPLKTLLETKKITDDQKMSICQLIIKHSIKILKSKTQSFETYPFL